VAGRALVPTHLAQEMDQGIKTVLLLVTWAAVDVLGAAAQTEGVVTSSCCPQVFLSSSGTLEQTQSAALGIYTLSSQKIAGNPHPVYLKSTPGQDFYLYFREQDSGPRGWLVGQQLLEDVFFLTTKQEASCPAGIVGAWGTTDEKDHSFSIECHSDQVKIDCCKTITLKASPNGPIATHQGGVLGDYIKAEDVNGHTAYSGPMGTSLFFRKAGYGPDGWMVGPEVDHESFMVTTRNKGICPNEVMRGFDRDNEEDSSLRMECTVPLADLQDPGVPSSPLVEPQRKSINSSAPRNLLCHMACIKMVGMFFLLRNLLR